MAGRHLRNIGRIALLVLIICTNLLAVDVKTELSDSTIHVGDSSNLKIMLSGSTSDIKPLKVPGVNGLDIQYTGSSRSFQFINGDVWSGVILNFRISPDKPGTYRIPPFVLEADGKKVSSASVTLRVLKGLKNSNRGSSVRGGRTLLRSSVEVSKKSVFNGEPLILRYFIYSSSEDSFDIEGMEKPPVTKGFVVKEIGEKIPASVEKLSGIDYVKKHVGTFCLIPTEAGDINLGGGSAIIAVTDGDSFFNFGRRKRINFPYEKVRVRALPSSGKPKVYGGDVGEFSIDVRKPEGELRQFDEIRLGVTVRGKGNLLTLSSPHIENSGIKAIFEKSGEELFIEEKNITGSKSFDLSIVPQKSGEMNLGAISFSFYNPGKGRYETVSSEPVALNILPGRQSKSTGEVKFDSDDKKINIDYKIVLIIFAVIFIIIAGVFFEKKRLKKLEVLHDGDEPVKNGNNGKKSTVVEEVEKNDSSEKEETQPILTVKDLEKALKNIDLSRLGDEDSARLKRFLDVVNLSRYGGGNLSDTEFQAIRDWVQAMR